MHKSAQNAPFLLLKFKKNSQEGTWIATGRRHRLVVGLHQLDLLVGLGLTTVCSICGSVLLLVAMD